MDGEGNGKGRDRMDGEGKRERRYRMGWLREEVEGRDRMVW